MRNKVPDMPEIPDINWTDERRFTLKQEHFRLTQLGDPNHFSSEAELVIAKPDWLIRRYAELLNELRPHRIIEIGIKQGVAAHFCRG